ncbi:MAG TPA: FtsK/SpoIIIE domain-containing protein [Ktedonobacterales bacterium]
MKDTTSSQRQAFNRPPRIWTAPPQGTIVVPAPPAKETLPTPPAFLTIFFPVLSVLVLVGITMIVNHGSMQELTFLLPMAVLSIMYPLSNVLNTRYQVKAVKRKNIKLDKQYRIVLKDLRKQMNRQVREQRTVALLTDPDPADLQARIQERDSEQSRLWERRPEDPDFLAVRVGRGSRPFSVEVQLPELDIADPLRKDVLQLGSDFATVKDIPCSITLPKVKSLGITGRRQDVAALTRGLLCQIATHHSPEDVRILGVYPIKQQQDWEWMADLPHTAPLKAGKLPQERLVAAGEEQANQLLNMLLEELSQRASVDESKATGLAQGQAAQASGTPPMPLPHLVVVVHDYVEVRKHPALTNAFKLGEQLGVSVIYLVAQQQTIPSECRGVIRLSDEGLVDYAAAGFAGETLHDVLADKMDLEMAQQLAGQLSPLHAIQEGEDSVDLPTNVRFIDLVNLPHADTFNPEQWWSAPPFGRLRVPIGMGLNGPVWLDLNENAHGPHGIIAGTTGAGKSELLQSLIVGLAITHHPHLVNFVLVDFKGGAAFKPFEKIPHTVGMVTDLSGRLTERALTALKSELKRREHMLSQANAKKIAEYQAMRDQNPSAYKPLPNLLIIIDEFAELAKEHPTFMEGLVSVVQKGRSLGVHLILATQKPTGSVNPNIWSNLKFRVCLRVASLQDSRDMLGRSEAALLPSTIPGRAYFQIGSEVFELFQSARISLPARVSDQSIIVRKQAEAGAGEVTDQQVLMDLIEPYQASLGKELFHPWPSPLPNRVSLQEILRRPDMPPTPMRQGAQPPYGWLTFPLGLVDLPAEQQQKPFLLDMPRQGGHVIVAGASGSGKSTFLRTLVTSLIMTHSPSQLNLYMVDFGGQSLRVFEKLPHVGGIFGESDEEYIRRLLHKLQGMIEERKQLCMTHQIDDFLTYQRRQQGNVPSQPSPLPAFAPHVGARFIAPARPAHGGGVGTLVRLEKYTPPPPEAAPVQMEMQPSRPELPAIVLVIDKFVEFKQAHDKDMETLISIARHGRTYGVYLVISLDRPISLPTQLLSLIELRVGLRLVELTDSLILIGKNDAAHLDPALPGRGYNRSKSIQEVQIALPVQGDDDDEQARKLDELVSTIGTQAERRSTQRAPEIRLLPEYVRLDDYLIEAAFSHPQDQRGLGISLRLGIEDLSLQPISVELNADTPHMLVGGGPGSGRTSVLQTFLVGMAAAPANKDVRVVMIDFRRSSRPLRRLPHMWHYADTEQRLTEAIDGLKTELRQRMTRLREALDQQDQQQQTDSDEPICPMTPLLLVIDDYDQLSVLTRNPLNDLKEFLLQARDLHFHIIVAGAPADLLRSEVLLQQVRACRVGVILGGDPQDQPLLGVRMSDLPAGRGHLVRRNRRYLVQIAYLEPSTLLPWAKRLNGTGNAQTN